MQIRIAALIVTLSLLAACGQAVTPQVASPSPATPAPAPTVPPTAGRVPLVVFAAGSLIIPFNDLEKAFEARYPNIDVQAEYHGSIQVMRHATELHEPIDIVATADATLIPMLMYAANNPDTGQPYADWHIRFASNKLAVAYTLQSKYADEINASNWYEVLARRDVRTGLSDPRFDALGYRALMAFALANDYYDNPKIFTSMFNGRFATPVTIFQDDAASSDAASTTITVPEIVDTNPETGLILRGASIQLIALLESGDIDYAFEYESVIQQHGLQMLSLPDAINLGLEGIDYSKVMVSLDFRRFASVKPEFRGERIGYGIVIPSSAPHPQEAALFIAFLLGPEGRAVMEADHHPMADPPVCDGVPPAELQGFCQ